MYKKSQILSRGYFSDKADIQKATFRMKHLYNLEWCSSPIEKTYLGKDVSRIKLTGVRFKELTTYNSFLIEEEGIEFWHLGENPTRIPTDTFIFGVNNIRERGFADWISRVAERALGARGRKWWEIFWLLDDRIVDGIRKEGISEIGKRRACKWTDRSNFLGTRARSCICVRKYASLSLDRLYRPLSLSCVRLRTRREERRIREGERPSFPLAREAKLRGNWPTCSGSP